MCIENLALNANDKIESRNDYSSYNVISLITGVFIALIMISAAVVGNIFGPVKCAIISVSIAPGVTSNI